MKKVIIMILVAILVLVGMVAFLLNSKDLDYKDFLMVGILVVVVGLAVILIVRRMRDARNKLPAEDEMSRDIKRRGASTSYYISLYMWLAIMIFEERLELERDSLIGGGILGMALIYALSWIYHNYISRTHD